MLHSASRRRCTLAASSPSCIIQAMADCSSTPLELSQLEDFLLLDALVDDHHATLNPSTNQLIINPPYHADNAALELWPSDELLINGIHDQSVADWSQLEQISSDHEYSIIDNKHTHNPTSNSLLMGNYSINHTIASVSLSDSISKNSSGLLRYNRNIFSPSLYPRTSLDHQGEAGYNIHAASTQLHRRPNPRLDALKWAINDVVNPSSNCLNDVCPADDELAFARSCLSALDSKRAIIKAPDYGLNLKPMKLKQCKFGLKLTNGTETESKRRKHMTRLFYTLRALLPKQLVPQNDRCRLIDETCNYIGALEKEVESLRRKAKVLKKMNDRRMGRGSRDDDDNIVDGGGRIKDDNYGNTDVKDGADGGKAPHVEVACAGGGKVVYICMGCHEKVAGLFPTILSIVDRRGLEVVSANRSQHGTTTLYAIHTKVKESFALSRTTINELQAELHIKATSKS